MSIRFVSVTMLEALFGCRRPDGPLVGPGLDATAADAHPAGTGRFPQASGSQKTAAPGMAGTTSKRRESPDLSIA